MSETNQTDREESPSLLKDAEAPDKLTDPVVESARTAISADIGEVVFSALKGLRRYQIVRAPQKMLDEWSREVDKIAGAIAAKDFPLIRELMMNGDRLTGDADIVQRLILDEELDDTDIRLLAIGLFILREKSPWNLNKTRWKVLKGGKIRMESAFEQDGWANCYDVAVIVRELAKIYGINGEIYGAGWSHAHFETEDGKVSDPMYGWKRGGLFQLKEDFEAVKKEKGLLRRLFKKR